MTAVLLTAFATGSVAQEVARAGAMLPIDEESKRINFEKIVDVEDTKKDDLFDRAVAWIESYYKNPADVVREKNRDLGKITCKARFKIFNRADKDGLATDAGVVQYTLIILFKDGKYKYQLTDYNWKQLSYYPAERWMDTSSSTYNDAYAHYLDQVDEYTAKTTGELEVSMAEKKKEKKSLW